MAVSSYRRVARKALRQPDQFISTFDRVGDWIRNNSIHLIFGALGLVVAVAIVFGFWSYSQHRQLAASREFYRALNALRDKDYQAAERDFGKVTSHYPGSKLGRLAKFYLGNTYLDEHQPGKACDVLRQYLSEGDHRLFRQMALMQLAVASEDIGNYAQAHSAYASAARLNGPEKARAEIGAARTLSRLGDRRGAIAAYQRFLRENPFARERGEVTEALAQMGVPAGQTPDVTGSAAVKSSGHE
jgi:predicted negative regulator of RcsB-dependent stress response